MATNGAVRVEYRFDAFGRQIERRTSGSSVTTNRLYYAGWQLIAEYNGAGALQRKYVNGPGIDEPVRMRVTGGAGTNYYYHADGLGSVTEVTTGTGTKTESYSYDVYGTPTIYNAAGSVISTPSTGNRLLFTGRDRDPDTTLYNYRYRYYSPSLGRFVQVDPIGLRGGDIHLYRYVNNNPVSFVDPSGLLAGAPPVPPEVVPPAVIVEGALVGGIGLPGAAVVVGAACLVGGAVYVCNNLPPPPALYPNLGPLNSPPSSVSSPLPAPVPSPSPSTDCDDDNEEETCWLVSQTDLPDKTICLYECMSGEYYYLYLAPVQGCDDTFTF